MNSNLIKVAKVASVVLTIGGTILGTWVTSKENENILEKLVEKHLGK